VFFLLVVTFPPILLFLLKQPLRSNTKSYTLTNIVFPFFIAWNAGGFQKLVLGLWMTRLWQVRSNAFGCFSLEFRGPPDYYLSSTVLPENHDMPERMLKYASVSSSFFLLSRRSPEDLFFPLLRFLVLFSSTLPLFARRCRVTRQYKNFCFPLRRNGSVPPSRLVYRPGTIFDNCIPAPLRIL